MTPRDLERYLHAHIPLSAAMQVSVIEASEGQVVLGAPLAPNVNHQHTVFGGSASAVAILAAWSALYLRLAASGMRARLVIQRSAMSYDLPIAGDFIAKASAASLDGWETFARTFRRKGRARIGMSSTLWVDGREAGRFNGEFVALSPQDA